jgi:anti-sigma regulatory factor (Ser/Thr protein kinase)
VLAAAHAAGGELAREPLRRRIAGGLAEAVPAATFPSHLRFREVCEVANEPLPGGELFLCYGLTGARPAAGSAALLAVAVADREARLGSVLEEMENRVRQALPFSESRTTPAETAGVEKWVVMRQPEPGDAEWAASHGAQLLDFERFNQLIAARSEGCVAARWETVLRLPPEADFELAAVRALDLLAERAGCDAQAASQARAALVEACLNAFEHGRTDGSQSSSASVEVRLAAWPGCIEMAVSNPGAPFAPGADDPGQSSLHRGHGLKIIHAVMDQVIVSSDLNGTTIRMTKKFPYGPEGRTVGLPEHEQAASGI